MASLYHTGDNIPLKFVITDEKGPVTPTVAKITILKPDHGMTTETDAAISENEVSYLVPTTDTNIAGLYKAYFILTLPAVGIRTHKIEFKVFHNP